MNPGTSIVVDGVSILPSDFSKLGEIATEISRYLGAIAENARIPEPSPIRIAVLQRGWVFVGRWSQEGDIVTLTDAACIRIWGTTAGLPELCNGPTSSTKLDKTPLPVRFHILTLVLALDVKTDAWTHKL